MSVLMQIAFFYMLANIAATISFFAHQKQGWVNRSEPAILFFYFSIAGIGWTILVAMIKLWCRESRD